MGDYFLLSSPNSAGLVRDRRGIGGGEKVVLMAMTIIKQRCE